MILRIILHLCSLVRLSHLQQKLLNQISQTKLNTTQFATQFSVDRAIPKSTVWFNIRKLRDSSLVKFNSKITLTKVGKIIQKQVSQGNSELCSANLRKQISQGSSIVEQAAVENPFLIRKVFQPQRTIREKIHSARKVGGANPSLGTCHMARGKNE